MGNVNRIAENIKEKIANAQESHDERSTGRIVYAGDGIIKVSGISGVKYNELLEIKGGYHALTLNLEPELVGAVLFSGEDQVRFGDFVYSTGKTLEIGVGEAMLGRVVSPLGEPLDGLGAAVADGYSCHRQYDSHRSRPARTDYRGSPNG